ncbi:MAG: VWA domain-containing protein [Nannocystis sp.]|nr:VWA domain-containing protein [Nannocystis sp.]MBA3544897.1 VWA domain-containing protein [Nannocystis sp.]
MSILRTITPAFLIAALGCGPDKDGSTDGVNANSGSSSTSGTSGDDPTDGGGGGGVAIAFNKEVDVLFVIDNSGSMAEEQALLSQNFASFIGVLESAEVAANYRIGITTTDAGNPRCPNTTPENGTLVLSSCLDRVASNEFKYNNADFGFTCTDYCAKTDGDLKVRATTTQYDATPAPRKWIERSDGQSNIEGADSNVEAFQCYGPQGVAGCGFESHLESMYKALAKASDVGSPANYGFLREAAVLSIVILTDEADCSYQQAQKDVFIGNKVFWNSPDDVQPTSALCWRAGVECTGDSPYSECHAANWGIDNFDPKVGVADADAVLKPVSEYVGFVKTIEAGKQNIDASQRVLVSMIAGVPVGYDTRATELTYADSPDPDHQALFGIGPGCVLAGDDPSFAPTAMPPVREREFAEAFADPNAAKRNLYSICQQDYSGALQSIADEIADQIKPACMPYCVRDTDPDSPDTLEPDCQVYQESFADPRTAVSECSEVNGVWTVPAGQTVCFAMKTDTAGATPSAIDDMSKTCVDNGYNLEFILVRSGPAPEGVAISATCELSQNKKLDCPKL